MPSKWTEAKPAEKLLSLYTLLLFDARSRSLGDLAVRLGCSKPTVLRLIDQLESSAYCKIATEKRGREAFYALLRPTTLPKISLNAEGLYQLALCREFMLHLLPEGVRRDISTTLQQAAGYLPEGASVPETDFVTAATKGRIDYTPFQERLDTLLQAIHEQKVCAVCYTSALGNTPRAYDYAPKRLVAYHEVLYLLGWVVTDKGRAETRYSTPTQLYLHRLEQVQLTRRSTAHLPDIEENGEAFGLMDETEPFQVEVRFDASAATYVAERQWSAGQSVCRHQDGSITLTFQARSATEALAWVLGFGPVARVEAPSWLAAKAREKVHAMAERYACDETAEPATVSDDASETGTDSNTASAKTE